MSPTRYTVTATDAAIDELTTIWLNHPSERGAITKASSALESALRQDAVNKGVLSPTINMPLLRYLRDGPLRVYFLVSDPDRLVTIVGYEKLNPTA